MMPVQSSLRPPHENRHRRRQRDHLLSLFPAQAQHPHRPQNMYHLQSHNIPPSRQQASPSIQYKIVNAKYTFLAKVNTRPTYNIQQFSRNPGVQTARVYPERKKEGKKERRNLD